MPFINNITCIWTFSSRLAYWTNILIATYPSYMINFRQKMHHSTHQKGPCSWVTSSKLPFRYFLNGCSFSSILVQRVLKSDTTFSTHSNFIHDIITDWWTADIIWRKGLLKVLEFEQSIGISNLKFHFDMKRLFLTLWYFEILWLCTGPITQNQVFWQLVPFDMLSHRFK